MEAYKVGSGHELCRVLISCPDSRGIVAAVSGLIAEIGGNILDADQHTERDPESTPGTDGFYMRVVAEIPGSARAGFETGFGELESRYSMQTEWFWGRGPDRVVVLTGHETHCLSDLLWRWGQGELGTDVVAVISNHDEGRAIAESAGVPFEHLPVEEADRASQEDALGARLESLAPDLIVLARYMRVLPAALVERYPHRIINIHHGFLPAFAGARPYHQAHDRGVKLIGATSHYVTETLDEGPIIAQETGHVSHRDDVGAMLRRLGRDLERFVLARAVRLHLERRVLIVGRRTIVFE